MATEFVILDNIPVAVRKLVSTSLLPLLQSQDANYVIAQQGNVGAAFMQSDWISPFIVDGDRQPLAGSITVHDHEWWWLPGNTPDKNVWVVTALSEWSKSDPEKFPPDPVWIERPQWQTKEERDATSELKAMREKRDRLLAELESREQELTQKYTESRREADRCERRLLTAQGNSLVEEVQAALKEIGFNVRDVDVDQAPKGTLLEDLRIEDPSDSGWISLAEVRGYTGGAKVSDLQRIGRFVEHYIRTEGKAPSARWYIVNHNLNMDPSARPPVLAGSAEDVSIFADANGLVIDTRILFKIRDQVQVRMVEPEAARQSLREEKGIMNWSTYK